jgi:hypothetical protein
MGTQYVKTLSAFALSFSLVIFADHSVADCKAEIDSLGPSLTDENAAQLTPEVISEAVRLFDEAISYCALNQEAEALQRIAEARALLGAQQ